MTAGLVAFDDLESNAHWQALRHIMGHDWLLGEEEYARFVMALFNARRGPDDEIHVDDVRKEFLEETTRGRRIDIDPHRYSAYWARAHAERIVDFLRVPPSSLSPFAGLVVLEQIRESPSGNNGKWMPVRVWRGGVA